MDTLTEYKTATSPMSSPSFQSLGSETTIRANAVDKMVLKKNRQNIMISTAANFLRINACQNSKKVESQYVLLTTP